MSPADDASERTLGADARGSSDTAGLYDALGVDRGATPAEIKRAYRRLALRHHPDRNHGAPASSTGEFVRIQYAYDVLLDERRRRIYDRYGEIGVQMAGRVGGELLDPHVSGLLSAFAFATAAAALLLIAFFALLARRVDHSNAWPFAVIFAPLWTVDFAALATVALAAVRVFAADGGPTTRDTDDAASGDAGRPGDGPDSSPDDSEGEIGLGADCSTAHPCGTPSPGPGPECPASGTQSRPPPPTDATPLLGAQRHARRSRQRLRRMRRCAEARIAKLAALAPVVYMLLLIAFQVALVLRLDGHVGWTALQVAVPWLCIESIHFVLLTLQLLAGLLRIREQALAASEGCSPQPGPSLAKRVCVLAVNTYWWLAIRGALGLLVVAKLSGALDSWSWAAVFVPAYLPAAWWAVALCFLRRQLRVAGSDAETLQNENAIVLACVAAFGVVTTFVYSFVALLVWRLSQPLAVRLVLVFVPVFVALSLVCCCCSCCGLCLAYGIEATLETDISDAQPNSVPATAAVPASRRIE
ncbi:hypothetical protein LPJ61_002406 [Coemansia biformis]|uniref:J domain-containing protein n=1 Tax=Coemansia biformis TaxID=1286918 RepID=A0A9W8CZ75_9FUNG|nr:hypothetical protein LPJ61_002406 [Coemansia biformis]